MHSAQEWNWSCRVGSSQSDLPVSFLLTYFLPYVLLGQADFHAVCDRRATSNNKYICYIYTSYHAQADNAAQLDDCCKAQHLEASNPCTAQLPMSCALIELSWSSGRALHVASDPAGHVLQDCVSNLPLLYASSLR